MATIDWPTGRLGEPQGMSFGASTSKTAWASPYTGQVQSISYNADRLRLNMRMPPCRRAEAGPREAFVMELASAGHWVRMYHRQRPVPVGTLRGSPTVAADALAGARSITLNVSAGAPTLVGGDMLGIGGQLVPVGSAGAVGAAGVMVVPLALPLRVAVGAGAAVVWDRPTGTFQLTSVEPMFDYEAPGTQVSFELTLMEVFA